MVPIDQIGELLPIRKIGEEEEELVPIRKTGEKKELDMFSGLSKAESIGPAKRGQATPSPLSSEYWRGVSKHVENIPGLVVKGVKALPDVGPAVYKNVVEPALGFVEKNPTITGWELTKQVTPAVTQMTVDTAKSLFNTITHPFDTMYNDPVRFVSDAAIILGGTGAAVRYGLKVAPKVSNAFRRISVFKKAGKAPLEADLKVVAQSMVDDAPAYQSALEKMAATSGRSADDIKTWREMTMERVSQKPAITEPVPSLTKKATDITPKDVVIRKTKKSPAAPVVDKISFKPPAGEPVGQKIKTAKKTVEEVVKEPVSLSVPRGPEILDIPSSAMGMSLDEFEAARASGEIIGNIPRVFNGKMYTAGGDLKEAWNNIAAPQLKKDYDTIKQMFHSPDEVFAKSPQTAINYTLMDNSNFGKLGWLNRNTVRTEAARKFIKKDSPLDYAISKLRNKVVDTSAAIKMSDDELLKLGLNKAEISDLRAYPEFATKLDTYLDESYDQFIRQWGITKVTGQEERKLWKLAADAQRSGKPIDPKVLEKMAPESQDVYHIYKNKIPKYITRLFPKKDALEFLQQESANIESMLRKIKPTNKRYQYWEKRKKEIAESLEKISSSPSPLEALGPEARKAYERMYGGDPVFFDYLPQRVSNKFFQRRLGKKGYDPSAIKSFYTYMAWMGKKIWDEPVIKYIHDNFDKVPMDLREYMKWYVQDYMGYTRNPLDSLYGSIKSLMWTKALGFNPRSAIVNLTQRVNILADSNPRDVAKAYAKGFTSEGKRLYSASGLGQTIPQVMMEGGDIGGPLEGLRFYAGWMFSKVEDGNVKLAFLTGVEEATRKGKTLSEAMTAGIKKAEKTQFRYGKIGTPRALRGAGGVVFQFWSYPVKQVEFLNKLWKQDKKKFIAWVALSEGSNQTLQQFLDTDLSNALGIGVNWGEILEGMDALGEGDVGEFLYRLTKRGGIVSGGGLLPYGPGPAIDFAKDAVGAAGKVVQAIIGQEGWDEAFGSVSQAIEPGASRRIRQAYKAIKEGPNEEGLYPIRKIGSGYLQYEEPIVDVAKRTLVGRPMIETRDSREIKAKMADQKAVSMISTRISDLIVKGDDEAAERISKAWGGIWPSRAAIKSAYLRYLGRHPKDSRALLRFRNLFLEEEK